MTKGFPLKQKIEQTSQELANDTFYCLVEYRTGMPLSLLCRKRLRIARIGLSYTPYLFYKPRGITKTLYADTKFSDQQIKQIIKNHYEVLGYENIKVTFYNELKRSEKKGGIEEETEENGYERSN